jgi:hypothetical protein
MRVPEPDETEGQSESETPTRAAQLHLIPQFGCLHSKKCRLSLPTDDGAAAHDTPSAQEPETLNDARV